MNTGKHYVGSAYGSNGIWGRWSDYIYGCHGNNKELKELYAIHSREYFKKHFKFTILEVLSSSMIPEEVIKIIDGPVKPMGHSFPNTKKFLLVSVIVGLFLGCSLAFILNLYYSADKKAIRQRLFGE